MASRRRTPLRCPVCSRGLDNTQIIPLGAVTSGLPWELHAGHCPEHGWFQCEVISRPPREIFPVSQPGGTVRTFTINGVAAYAFPTIWNSQVTPQRVDPYDDRYWEVDWSMLPEGAVSF